MLFPIIPEQEKTAPNSHGTLRMSRKMLLRTLENLLKFTQEYLRPSCCFHNPTTDHTPVERRTKPTHIRLPPGRIQVSVSHIFNAEARGEALTKFVGATQTRNVIRT